MAPESPDNTAPTSDEEQPQAPAFGLQAIGASLTLPLEDDELANLRAGEWVTISGTVYLVGRRAADLLREEWQDDEAPAFVEPEGSVMLADASAAPLGKVMGSLAPLMTGQHAMLCCTMLDAGTRAIIGSGAINDDMVERLKKKRGVYLHAMQGAGALLARSIHQAEVVACEGLEQGAIRRVKVSRMPCVIALDGFGRYIF